MGWNMRWLVRCSGQLQQENNSSRELPWVSIGVQGSYNKENYSSRELPWVSSIGSVTG